MVHSCWPKLSRRLSVGLVPHHTYFLGGDSQRPALLRAAVHTLTVDHFDQQGRPHLRRRCPTLQRSVPRTKTTCRAPPMRGRSGSSTPRPPASCSLSGRGSCGGSPARLSPGMGSGSGFRLQCRVTTAWLGTTLLKCALRVDDVQQLKVQRYRGGMQCLSVPWSSCALLRIAGRHRRRNAASTPASAAAAQPM